MKGKVEILFGVAAIVGGAALIAMHIGELNKHYRIQSNLVAGQGFITENKELGNRTELHYEFREPGKPSVYQGMSEIEGTGFHGIGSLTPIEYLNGNHADSLESLDLASQLLAPGSRGRIGYMAYVYGLLGYADKATVLLGRFEKLINEPQSNDAAFLLSWAILGTRDKALALDAWTVVVNGYLDENKPMSPGRIGRFRDNWLNDPMLDEPEFLALRRRLGFEG